MMKSFVTEGGQVHQQVSHLGLVVFSAQKLRPGFLPRVGRKKTGS